MNIPRAARSSLRHRDPGDIAARPSPPLHCPKEIITGASQSIPNQTLGDFLMESIPLRGKLCLSATLGVMFDRSQYFDFTASKVNRKAVLNCR
jgi:hypothetical protein